MLAKNDDDPSAEGRAPWQAPETEQVFAVTFGDGGTFGLGARPNDSLGLVGQGELRIGPDGILLLGKKRGTFSSKDERHAFNGNDISNVQALGASLRFRIPNDESGMRHVELQAADAETAKRIESLLPATRSARFAAELAALTEFHERLAAVSRPPLVARLLVIANVAVFVAMAFAGAGVFEPQGDVAVRWGSNYSPLTADGQWWRLLTATFIHFGVIHLALNMLALYQSGETAERLYGRGRFLALYLFAGLTGSLASLIWHPLINSAGASGAIFGVFGGLLAFVLDGRNKVPASVMTEHRNSTLLFAGYSLFYGAVHPNIDNAAHIGGLLGGFLMGLLLARPVDAAARARPATARLALASVAGVALLGGLLFTAMHPSGDTQAKRGYYAFMDHFEAREDHALGLMNEAGQQLSGEGGQEAYARLMGEAGDELSVLLKDLQAYSLEPGSEEAVQQAALVRYVDARVRLARAAPKAATGDPTAVAEAERASSDAEAALAELN